MPGQLRFCSLKGNPLVIVQLLSFLHPFGKHLLSNYSVLNTTQCCSVLNTVLSIGGAKMNKAMHFLTLKKLSV